MAQKQEADGGESAVFGAGSGPAGFSNPASGKPAANGENRAPDGSTRYCPACGASNHEGHERTCPVDSVEHPAAFTDPGPFEDLPTPEDVREMRCDSREAISSPAEDTRSRIDAISKDAPPVEPPIRTVRSPLSELPRCIVCRDFVGSTFKVVDIHLGVVNPRGVQHVAGLAMAHRLPLKLAEIFSAEPEPVNITDDPRIDLRAFFCMECYSLSDMPMVEEQIHRRAEQKS